LANSYLAPGLRGHKSLAKGGKAVYAAKPLAAGTLLVVWGGDVLSRRNLEKCTNGVRRLVLQVDDDAFLLSTAEGPADWINHSCDPNAGLRGQISLVAMRDIDRGEEICFDYAMSDGSDYDEFDCNCGSMLCRGRVSGDDWRRRDLIDRYDGYFSPYIALRIAELRLPRRMARRERQHAPAA